MLQNPDYHPLGPSLDAFLQEEQTPDPLQQILQALVAAGKALQRRVNSASLSARLGFSGTYNPSGDRQQQLDVEAHTLFVQALAATNAVGAVLSEEVDELLTTGAGAYIVALDPLDGSLNSIVNGPMGTLFSVYQRSSPAVPMPEEVLQPGNQQVAAGYFLYGLATVLVYTCGQGVHVFTYEPAQATFVLTQRTVHMPLAGTLYAINDGYFLQFPSAVQRYIHYCRQHHFSARYTGALVADFHRILIQGGIYMYPPTQKHPKGKLRLLLECNALAWVAQQAGGTATDGQQAILTIQPTSRHQSVPCYIGSTARVEQLVSHFAADYYPGN